jgi:hypothetical protein
MIFIKGARGDLFGLIVIGLSHFCRHERVILRL